MTMKLSSKEANKLLKKLNEDYQLLLNEENENSTFIASITENVEDCRPKYNYDETQKQLEELESKIRKLKHAINVFNTTTKVDGFDMYIDEVLIMLPQLSQKKEKLSNLRKNKEKTRVKNKFGEYYGERVDYTYINYNLDQVKSNYEKIVDDLNCIQIALDKANIKKEIEIKF